MSSQEASAAAAAVRQSVAKILKRSTDGAACEAVSRLVNEVLDAALAAHESAGAPVACAPGCTFCCHQRVTVFEHEAAALLRHLRTSTPHETAAAIEQQIVANAGSIDALTAEQHRAANLRCAFLVSGRCAAYESRPSACARYHSLSRARCERAYEHPHDLGTARASRPVLAEVQSFGAAVDSALEAALADTGLSAEKGELHQKLRVLLADASEARDVTPSSAP